MQFVKYRPKEHFEPIKYYQRYPRWRQNSKWCQNKKILIFAAKWPIFNGFHKNFSVCYLSKMAAQIE
jgi:hypothetical protein